MQRWKNLGGVLRKKARIYVWLLVGLVPIWAYGLIDRFAAPGLLLDGLCLAVADIALVASFWIVIWRWEAIEQRRISIRARTSVCSLRLQLGPSRSIRLRGGAYTRRLAGTMARIMARVIDDWRQAALTGGLLLGFLACGCARLGDGLPPRLNLPEGFTWEAKMAVETKCATASYPDEKVSHRRERAVGFLCRVKEKCPDGSMKIEFKYNWVRDFTMPDALDVYNSADPNAPRGWGHRKRMLDALLGRSFVAEVTAEGKVRKLDDFEDFYRGLHDVLTYIEPPSGRILIRDKEAHMRFRKKEAEKGFQEFFTYYWPLSEEALTETIQEFFVIWPRPGKEKGRSWHTEQTVSALALRRDNAWTLKENKQERIAIELLSQEQTDLSLCNSSAPSIPNELSYGAWDFLSSACLRYQKWQYPTNYAGQRKGFFDVNPKSGLIRTAAWNEELSGTVQFPDPRKSTQELMTCPTERTCSVTIQITPGN